MYKALYLLRNNTMKLGIVVHNCNPSTWWSRGRIYEHEFADSLGYMVRQSHKTKEKETHYKF
jgi:hypothetical protein